ncbi:MAG: DUF1376 domain-containing protein [Burkholderiaceae bacterium]|nr:DUF1376 domain-containing protein [Burkholderiaceae bacterium]
MSKEAPDVWFPLMVSAYMKKTWGLTTEQHGAYLLLLINYWIDGPPADDDALLAGLARLDTRRWKAMRPVMLRYFHIEDGHWRQDRADEELKRWAERKAKFAERGAAGGRAKAKNATSSTLKAERTGVLSGYPSSPSTGVEGPSGLSTPCGQNEFNGPKEIRQAFVDAMGEAWTARVIDLCRWQDLPDRALIPRTGWVASKLIEPKEARAVLKAENLTVLERTAA